MIQAKVQLVVSHHTHIGRFDEEKKHIGNRSPGKTLCVSSLTLILLRSTVIKKIT